MQQTDPQHQQPVDRLEAPERPLRTEPVGEPVEVPAEPKAGAETSEFKLTAIVQLVTVLAGVGAILWDPNLPADAIVEVVKWVGGLLVGSSSAYAVSRGLAKRGGR